MRQNQANSSTGITSVLLCTLSVLFVSAAVPVSAAGGVDAEPAPPAPRRALPRLFPEEAKLEDPQRMIEKWGAKMARHESHLKAVEQALLVPEFPETGVQPLSAGGWDEIGPGIHNPTVTSANTNHFSGRIVGAQYAYDAELDRNVLFVAASGGGIWRLDLVGLIPIWRPLSDNIEGIPSTGAFLVDPTNADRMLLGAGDWKRTPGGGAVYQSLDGGATWTEADLPDGSGQQCFTLVQDRTDPKRVLLASTSGIFVTDRFGTAEFGDAMTWTHPWTSFVTDIVQDPTNDDRWLAGGRDGILESVDGGASFHEINEDGGTGIPEPRQRIALAVSAASSSHVFALVSGHNACTRTASSGFASGECTLASECAAFNSCSDDDTACIDDDDCSGTATCRISQCSAHPVSGLMNGVYRSDDTGFTWRPIESVDRISWNQAFHTTAIGVDQTDPNRLFVGMGDVQWTENATAIGGDVVEPVLWRRVDLPELPCDSNDDGTIDVPNTASCDLIRSHADHTDFLFLPTYIDPNGATVLITNDGGYYFYDTNANTIDGTGNKLGLTISQTMGRLGSLGGSYTKPDLLVAGLQDNGMVRIDKTQSQGISWFAGGDGGTAQVSPDEEKDFFYSLGVSYNRYYTLDQGSIKKNVNCSLGNEWTMGLMTSPTKGLGSKDLFTHSGDSLWYKPVSTTCDWAKINPGAPLPSDFNVNTIDMANNPAGAIFYVTGWSAGNVLVLDESVDGVVGSMAWRDVTPIAILDAASYDYKDAAVFADRSSLQPRTAYFTTRNGRPSRAIVTEDAGNPSSWRDVTGNLATLVPDADYNELVGNPSNLDQLFLATDVGVFRTDSGLDPSPIWYRYMANLPEVVQVMALELNYDNSPTGQPRLHIGTYGRGFWERDVLNSWGGSIPDGSVDGEPLRLAAGANGGIALTWDSSCSVGDSDYAIYEGTLGDFGSHFPYFCSTNGNTAVSLTPSQGNTYYMVVPVAFHGQSWTEGSLGYDSQGEPRSQGLQFCYQQEVGECN